MKLKDYIDVLMRRKWIILMTLLITEIVVTVGTLKATPIYSSTAILRVASSTTGNITFYDYQYADRLMNTFVKLATTTQVVDELKLQLGVEDAPSIDVESLPVTELIEITVEDSDPVLAANAANTMADILIGQSLELYLGSGETSQEILSEQLAIMEAEVKQARKEYLDLIATNPSNTAGIQTAKQKLDLQQQMYATVLENYEQMRLKETARKNSIYVVEPATPPQKPSKPIKELNIALGFLVGAIGGIGLAFLLENLDTTLNTTDQIEAITKLPSIGRVPALKSRNSVAGLSGDFVSGESFSRLRTNILLMENPVRTLLISSAEPKDGKSTIAANLAYAMAQSGRKVILIDGDLRVPSQHKIFNVDNSVGLSSILEQKASFAEAVQSTEFLGLQVLSSGPIPKNPSGLLGSSQMKKLIEELSNTFELVIIDSPAVLAVSDASVLAPMVDAVAIVVCRTKTNLGAVRALQAQLHKVKARSIGVIVNRAEDKASHYYYYNRKEAFLPK